MHLKGPSSDQQLHPHSNQTHLQGYRNLKHAPFATVGTSDISRQSDLSCMAQGSSV